MDWQYNCRNRRLAYCYFREMVKMNEPLQIVLFLLALVNLVAISVLIYFQKSNWSLALAIVEIIIVYLSLTT